MTSVLEMALQPIVDLASGRVVGVESLARFEDRRPPDEHFAEARTRVRRQALELAAVRAGLARIRELPSDAYLTVNVSPDVAATRELAVILADAPAQRIILEITEHAPVSDYVALGDALAGFRARGLRVAIDDAGAGFASMRHVLALHPDVIKLDISIIRGIDADAQRREFVRALVQFAGATGCTLVAEGIETREELAEVRKLGVGCGQGFWLGRPGRSAAGPWHLPLPPMKNAQRESRGRFGRVARPAAVLLAAVLTYPAFSAVAGLKAPASGGRPITPPAAAVVRSEVGGSTLAQTKAHRPAIILAPKAPKIDPAVNTAQQTLTAESAPTKQLVPATVDAVEGAVSGLVDTTANTVDAPKKTLGGLLGGKVAS